VLGARLRGISIPCHFVFTEPGPGPGCPGGILDVEPWGGDLGGHRVEHEHDDLSVD
jgi:hypothetical protein